MPTEFRLATRPYHYKNIYDFLRKEGRYEPNEKLQFPTIFALRNGEVVGVIGRHTNKNAVIVGELTVKDGNNPGILLIKLVEVWDAFMVRLGVVEYLAPVYKTNDKFLAAIKRIVGQEPYAEDEQFYWFKRRLG